jgi:hypothetical protein
MAILGNPLPRIQRAWQRQPYLILSIICTVCVCIATLSISFLVLDISSVIDGRKAMWIDGGIQAEIMDWPASTLEITGP